MNIPGYDAWKLQVPGEGPFDQVHRECEECDGEGCPTCDPGYDPTPVDDGTEWPYCDNY